MTPFAVAVLGRQLAMTKKRRRRRIPRQRQPNAERLAYAHLLLAMMARARELLKLHFVNRLPDWVRAAGFVHDAIKSYPDEIADTLDRVAEQLFGEFGNERIRRTALSIAQRVNTAQAREINRQLAAAVGQDIGINVFADAGMQARLEAFAAANVQLVKKVPQQFFDEVGARVVQGLRSGRRAEDLEQEIQDRFGVAESRARLIARDQVGKLYGELNKARQQDLGIEKFTWRTVGDERVRDEHEALDGKVFSWDDPPDEGIPGEPINCLPGDQGLSFAPGVVKLYRRPYSGELTELVTDAGEVLRATPNHPVLSGRGWLPIHALDVGDYVFQTPAQGFNLFVTDPERADPTLEEFFGAVAPLGIAHRVRGRAAWFHGDATDEQVDVVDVDWRLGDELDASISQRLCQNALALADQPRLRLGAAFKLFDGSQLAADRSVRGFCKAHALFGAGGGKTGDHCRAAIAWLDAVSDQAITDGHSSDAVVLRKLFYAPSGEVQPRGFLSRVLFGVVCRAVMPVAGLHSAFAQASAEEIAVHVQNSSNLGDRPAVVQQPRRVVEKRIGHLQSGHVYNLQTAAGWYVSQNLIVHNCRCTAEPDVQSLIDAL